MTDNQRFWGFSKTRLKSMLASELQDEDVHADLRSTKSRTLKARLIRTTDATGQVVDFKNSVVGPVVDSSYVALSADELLNRKRTVTGKALVGYEGDAEDGDDDGKIQDNTPWERPAPARNAPDRQKKPKRGKRQERTSKPKRRRLIDSLRNIGKRREGNQPKTGRRAYLSMLLRGVGGLKNSQKKTDKIRMRLWPSSNSCSTIWSDWGFRVRKTKSLPMMSSEK